MYKFCLMFTFIIVSAFVTTTISSPVQAHNSPHADGGNMKGSIDAQVHASIERLFTFDPVKIHLHSIAYADVTHHPVGHYTLAYKIEMTEKGKEKWVKEDAIGRKGGEIIEGVDADLDGFDKGCSASIEFNGVYSTDHVPGGAWWQDDYVTYKVSSTVENTQKEVTRTAFMKDGEHLAPAAPEDGDEGNNIDNTPSCVYCTTGCSACPTPGLSPANGSYIY